MPSAVRSHRSFAVAACILIALFLLAMASRAWASSSGSGLVSGILMTSQTAFFNHSGTRSTRPSCATIDRWAFDSSTAGGQSLLATLLTAYATGRQISVLGTGTCSIWGDTETVAYIQIAD